MMKRRGIGAAAALMMLLAACTPAKPAGGADPIELGQAMVQAAADLPGMSVVTSADERGEELFPYLSDLDYGKVDGYYFAYAEAGTAEEIAVIRLKDPADAEEAKASLTRHVRDRQGIFEVYDPAQVVLVKQAQVLTSGVMVALVICGEPGPAETAFRQGCGA